jgi:serine protease Do
LRNVFFNQKSNAMNRNLIFSMITALGISLVCIFAYHQFLGKESKTLQIQHIDSVPSSKVLYSIGEDGEIVSLDFTMVAEKVMDAVVHVKSTITPRAQQGRERDTPMPFRDFPFEDFFFRDFPRQDRPPVPQSGTGSGVIISEDGYILTNNHVIDNADDIEITLHDNRSYKAVVIGTDPSTDLALLQIKDKNLPFLAFADSDVVRVGEWVLAVGNPFNLTSTVTAGIVSAKGRNINILREQFAVESFIQTDAAINPGNSGGALVNLSGGLIGINTAIASRTGSFAGYGFAVPSNIAGKVAADLMKYGTVQRAVLGISIRTIDGNLAKEKSLNVVRGVYVDTLLENSAAGAAGILPGDVITAVDGMETNSTPKLQEQIARRRPGDEVELSILRNGKKQNIKVQLGSRTRDVVSIKKEDTDLMNRLGADFETLDKTRAKSLEIDGGVVVKSLNAGIIRRNTQMREGFIITKINNIPVRNTEELIEKLRKTEGGVMLEGIYPDVPGVHYFAFGM